MFGVALGGGPRWDSQVLLTLCLYSGSSCESFCLWIVFFFICKSCFYPVIFPVCFYLLHCGIVGNCWISGGDCHP